MTVSESSDSESQQPPPQNLPTSTSHTCQHCGRSFSTKTGLGVHTRRAHPDEADAANLRVETKARWKEEELLLMARKEAELAQDPKVRFMNQELTKFFKSRTLEAIKKSRQKPDYKAQVTKFCSELKNKASLQPIDAPQPTSPDSSPPSSPDSSHTAPEIIDTNARFLEYIKALPTVTCIEFEYERLQTIIDRAATKGKTGTFEDLTLWLAAVFPAGKGLRPPSQPQAARQGVSRRKKRREEYALTQKNWKKHQGRCIKSILEGDSTSKQPAKELMLPFWQNILEEGCDMSPGENETVELQNDLSQIWSPITPEEIGKLSVPLSSSPGPDGVTVKQLRALPQALVVRLLNLLLWCGRLPSALLKAKTVFIPKKLDSTEPGDFRPITVPSVLTRQLHAILAKRISNCLVLDNRQQAFQAFDGCANNTTLVDLLLRHHNKTFESCYLASLDVSKAFDSVAHPAILDTLRVYNAPSGFTEYLKYFYNHSSTVLVGEGWMSPEVFPKKGVKQGDPLSPMLFNIVIDRLLRRLPSDVGVRIGTCKTNALAFADDLILAASTPVGLQTLLNTTESYLRSCGLKLNSSKCLTISIRGQPKQKKSVVEPLKFKVANRYMPSLKRSEIFKYLGINFTPDGRCKYYPAGEVQPRLDRLTRAPLKPQQRLHALRIYLIPQLHHKLTLGSITIGGLRKTDVLIRKAVRKWLNLPDDVPVAFFHASTNDGGLDIPSVRWTGPMLRLNRLVELRIPNLERSLTANTFLASEIDSVSKRLRVNGAVLKTSDAIKKMWSQKLYNSVDGGGLREAAQVPYAHRWIREPTKLLSGRDFINCVKIRINAFPTRSRTTRGREQLDRMCRAGCGVPETLNHVVQQCHRTHSARVERHDSVVAYLARSLKHRGFTIQLEPTYNTTDGKRKPDIIACKQLEAFVVDAQVVTDGRNMRDAHARKAAYYNTENMSQLIKRDTGCGVVRYTSATLNWRGVWCGESVKDLLDIGALQRSDLALIGTRVAIGGVRSFRVFSATTAMHFRRQGVG